MQASSGEIRIWWLALLAAAAVLAYANSFSTPFVFDDEGSIVDNAYIRHLWPLSSALSAPVQSAVAGRPVVSLSLALNYALSGLSPSAFRVSNLGIHVLAALVLFGVVRRTLRAPVLVSRFGEAADLLGLACALVWLTHPLQTEVIDYVIQRTESMMGLFYLLTLYAAIRVMSATGDRAWGWKAFAIAACALGMATKESMVTAPVMVVLYDAVFWADGIGRAVRARWHLYAALAATWLVLAALVVSGPRSHSAGFSSGVAPLTYLLNQPAMLVRYLKLTFWPHGLVLDYGVPRVVSWNDILPDALMILALLAATLFLWRRHRPLAFLGTWFFVTLAPTSSVVPIATEVGAERRMYLPLIAIVVGFVTAGWRLLGRTPSIAQSRRRTTILVVCVGVLSSALLVLTLERNREYQSRTGIWQTVLDRHPHGRAHYNLGMELKEQGNRPAAIREYQLALADEPAAHYAVAFELEADGKHGEAIAHYREYIRLLPDDVNVIRAYILLGRALKVDGQLDPASDAFRQALQRQPVNVDARAGLAEVLIKQERYDDAIQAYREYGRLQPNDATAHSGLGIALVGRGLEKDAIPEFARAVELDPNHPGNRYNLGNALASTGRLVDAESEYRRALALAPANVSIHNALGLVLAAQGRIDEALAQFRESLAIDPRNEQTQKDFATAFPSR